MIAKDSFEGLLERIEHLIRIQELNISSVDVLKTEDSYLAGLAVKDSGIWAVRFVMALGFSMCLFAIFKVRD